jgi:hypothetical protein
VDLDHSWFGRFDMANRWRSERWHLMRIREPKRISCHKCFFSLVEHMYFSPCLLSFSPLSFDPVDVEGNISYRKEWVFTNNALFGIRKFFLISVFFLWKWIDSCAIHVKFLRSKQALSDEKRASFIYKIVPPHPNLKTIGFYILDKW